MSLRFAPAFRASIIVGEIQEIGMTAKGRRRAIPILGGEFAGDDFNGVILPGGADWQLIRPDGVAEIDAQYTMQTTDGVIIYIRNIGLRHGPQDVMDRLARGEEVSPDEYYFRTSPTFEVESGRYDWLNRTMFVGVGERGKERVHFTFYAVS
jgi:hypothetical protein